MHQTAIAVRSALPVEPRTWLLGGEPVDDNQVPGASPYTRISNLVQADGKLDRERQSGWFVGWAQKDDKRLIFATLIKDDAKIAVSAGLRARDELLASLPKLLNGSGF